MRVIEILNPFTDSQPFAVPLFADRCQAGFPSPAQDYIERDLDLNQYCVEHKSATYYVRAAGESMKDARIQNGDLLVVDKSLKARHGDIVIASVSGEFTVKMLLLQPRIALQPMNSDFPTLYMDPDDLEIWGVVTFNIQNLRG